MYHGGMGTGAHLRKGEEVWSGRQLLCAALCVASAALPWAVVASGAGADRHPAELAAEQLGKQVTERLVVSDEEGGFDVWLFSDAPADKMRQRLELAQQAGVTLKGGYVVATLYEGDHDGSLTVALKGPNPLQLRVTPHLEGTLLVVPGVGRAGEAPAWAPAYHPLPISLPHGPLR